MDTSGKIIWARHNEVQTVNVKSLGSDYELADGERLPLAVKDLGACDLYPQVRQCVAGRGGCNGLQGLPWRRVSSSSSSSSSTALAGRD